MVRFDWTLSEIAKIYNQPFPELIFEAQTMHRKHFSPMEIQRSTLLSVKTGGCSEDCAYCPQSAHYKTDLEDKGTLPKEVVIEKATKAKESGSTRFCMGAAWSSIKDGKEFDHILDLVKDVSSMGLEVCCTLGMLTLSQAKKLKDAGCYAYNHNLDTSPGFYGNIITTRTYEDRLQTLRHIREAGITVCCGGIVGMGESAEDRLQLLQQLAQLNPHPESVPVNMLIKIKGTPLSSEQDIDSIEFVRMIATARILMPKSMVRLSAGRAQMSDEMQALAILAGANSIFAGEKLLTAPNPTETHDHLLIKKLGMKFMDTGCSATPAA